MIVHGRRGNRCQEHDFVRDRVRDHGYDHDHDRGCDRGCVVNRGHGHGHMFVVRSKNIVLCRQRDFIGAYGIFNNLVKYVDIYEIYADLLIAE